ncbi:MAG: CBS domain-containing protein [Burkholderiales bacterium]|nr:CBS domain-containing protein [Burkholderiales bacterium]
MTSDYPPLPSPLLAAGALLATLAERAERPSLDSPAIDVMTDFTRVPAATIEPGATVAEANQFMIRRGVRSLMVVDPSLRVLGIITARDVLGEMPVKVAQERKVAFGEVQVRDVMTPAERLEAVSLEEVAAAKVGNVVATLERSGRQHTLVVEAALERGRRVPRVRGIFSITQIARELGIPIEGPPVGRTFAEVEAALR